MRATLYVLVAILATLETRAYAESPGDPRAVVTRGVVHDAGGHPVAGAGVRCWWVSTEPETADRYGEDATAHTDGDGRFTLFTRMPKWSDYACLSVQHPDFGLALTTLSLEMEPVYVGATRFEELPALPEPAPENISITFMPERAMVAGTVTDHSGAPVSGATVTPILMRTPAPGNVGQDETSWILPAELTAILSTSTDTEGRFQIEGMPADTVFALRAWHPDRGLATAGIKLDGYQKALTLRPDAGPFTLALSEAGSLSGSIRHWEGTPLPGEVQLFLTRPDEPWTGVREITVGTDGGYHAGDLAAGRCTLVAVAAPLHCQPVRVAVAPGAHTAAPPLILGPGATIGGHAIHAETGDALEGVELKFTMVYQGEDVVTTRHRLEHGLFDFNARPGIITLYVRGISCTTHLEEQFRLVLNHGVLHRDLSILALPHTRIRGQVLLPDGSPGAGATLRMMGNLLGRADRDGKFAVAAPADSRDPTHALRVLLRRDTTCYVRSIPLAEAMAASGDMAIQLEEAAAITGVVLDPDGQPAGHCPIIAIKSTVLRAWDRTDDAGRFRLFPIFPGTELVLLPDGSSQTAVTPLLPGELRDAGTLRADPRAPLPLIRPLIEVTPTPGSLEGDE